MRLFAMTAARRGLRRVLLCRRYGGSSRPAGAAAVTGSAVAVVAKRTNTSAAGQNSGSNELQHGKAPNWDLRDRPEMVGGFHADRA